jgi:Cys-tRNA(Pro)/Cys-tRNA(Cys) deacylase
VSTPALAAAEAVGLAHRVIRHGPVRSLADAARARGVAPADVVKTPA